jgi:hypothetical protein
MQYIGKSLFNKILSYFHGNIHVTLSYGFLNWFVPTWIFIKKIVS